MAFLKEIKAVSVVAKSIFYVLRKHWDYIIPKIAGKFYAFCIIAQTFVHSCRKTQWQLSGTHFIGRYLVFSNVNVFFPDPNEIERKSMKSKFFSTKRPHWKPC